MGLSWVYWQGQDIGCLELLVDSWIFQLWCDKVVMGCKKRVVEIVDCIIQKFGYRFLGMDYLVCWEWNMVVDCLGLVVCFYWVIYYIDMVDLIYQEDFDVDYIQLFGFEICLFEYFYVDCWMFYFVLYVMWDCILVFVF